MLQHLAFESIGLGAHKQSTLPAEIPSKARRLTNFSIFFYFFLRSNKWLCAIKFYQFTVFSLFETCMNLYYILSSTLFSWTKMLNNIELLFIIKVETDCLESMFTLSHSVLFSSPCWLLHHMYFHMCYIYFCGIQYFLLRFFIGNWSQFPRI